jgi:hypothetical protein
MRLRSKRRRCNDYVPTDNCFRAPGSHLEQRLEVEGEHLGVVAGNVPISDDVNVRLQTFRVGRDGHDTDTVSGVLDKSPEQELYPPSLWGKVWGAQEDAHIQGRSRDADRGWPSRTTEKLVQRQSSAAITVQIALP